MGEIRSHLLKGILFLASAAVAVAGGLLGGLRVGEVLTVQCEERGCFHSEKIEVVFTRADALRAEAFEIEQMAVVPLRRRLGSVILTAGEAEWLDRLFVAFPQPTDFVVSSTKVRVRLRKAGPGVPEVFDSKFRFGSVDPTDFAGALVGLANRFRAKPDPAARSAGEPTMAGAVEGEPILEGATGDRPEVLERLLRQIEGVPELAQDYAFEDLFCLNLGPGEDVLGVTLRPRVPQFIDAIEWEIPIVGRRLAASDVRPALAQAMRQAEGLGWLRAWKERDREGRITLHLRGNEIGASAEEAANHLMPAWAQSGLSGRLRWRLKAERRPFDDFRRSALDLLMGDAETRVVLVGSNPPKANGWSAGAPELERVEVGRASGRKGEGAPETRYAVIEPDGRVEVKSVIGDR